MDAFADILATKGDQYTVVNVHTPYEGEIEGTDLKIPYDDVNALVTALPDKNAPIILYCRSGRMSEIAAKALADKGYTQIFDVPGGMIKWEESGRKVVDK
jgi:rhodanese-related sulfurtransferase